LITRFFFGGLEAWSFRGRPLGDALFQLRVERHEFGRGPLEPGDVGEYRAALCDPAPGGANRVVDGGGVQKLRWGLAGR
jgi:hypothetical protein